jgi:cation:H+ antiporter
MRAIDFHALPLWLNLPIFGGAALAVWIAGTRLASYADTVAG